MNTLKVNVKPAYDIVIRRNSLCECGDMIKNVTNAQKVAIITDSNVGKIYLEQVSQSIKNSGFEVFTYTFNAGEEQKNLNTIAEMLAFLADSGLTRKDIAVALGGGVCGDMAGFSAAIYLRGIDFIQIPTSLLAQIDSSVGGKTGADLSQGKNLVGAFHQPRLVIIDPNVLNTLPKKYFTDGMGEAIKYGCIKSEKLFERLENDSVDDFLEEMIYECVDIKRQVVENDEKEKGERMLLNFGHTFAHSLEKYYNFKTLTHGMAVGIGMLMITEIFEKKGLTQAGCSDRIRALLTKFDMPTECDAPFEDIISGIFFDKKRANGGINLVILESIGKSKTYFLKEEQIKEFFGV